MVMMDTATTIRRTLDQRRTAMMLARALQARAIVSFRDPQGSASQPWRGEVIDLDKSTVVLVCDGYEPAQFAGVTDRPVSAEFSLSNARYAFRSRLSDTPTYNEEGQIVVRLKRPETIAAIERRRSRRRFLSAGVVSIDLPNESNTRPLQGILLNLSVNGLACRMAQSEAARLTVGEGALGVVIRPGVPEGPDQLELCGHVVNITPAGTEEQAIVGVEFLLEETAPWVRDALAGVVARAGIT